MRMVCASLTVMLAVAFGIAGCGGGGTKHADAEVSASDAAADETRPGDARRGEATDALEVRGDVTAPVTDTEAAARAFRLYYRERVERAVVAYNRFMLFGDVGFATTIGKSGIARQGDEWEVVAGPNDNNAIGVSMWGVWHAYRVFRSRLLALSMIRMLEGLVFFEAVSGHPGLTARMVYPGWTRTVDGVAGAVTRTRGGVPVSAPAAADPDLEAEILAAFFAGVCITYREDPEDILLAYMPVAEIGPYSVTYSFSMLPDYLRVSDCCTSLKRTPAPYAWEGAYWGNHNSRDNFPDLSTGYLVAREAMDDPDADADVRAAAARAWAAGQRIGDLVQENGGRLMTVDEHNPYDVLVVAGGIRPDGETEAEDLGSLSDCPMAFLARALSTQGLAMPPPELPAPGSVEFLLTGLLGEQCPVPEPVRMCTRLQEAYCGKDWSTLGELQFLGKPWLDAIAELERQEPGTAQALIGSFQDDFGEKALAALALVHYAQLRDDGELLAAARKGLAEITQLMRFFGEIVYARTNPPAFTERIYEMALLEAQGGLAVALPDFNDFARAEAQIAYLESRPDMPDTVPVPLKTDEEILQLVQDRLAGASGTAKKRYEEAYGGTPPVRRAGEGYEARGFHEAALWPWAAVDNHHHQVVGGVKLLEALPLCVKAPQLLDCTWARLGCHRPDLDASRAVDAADAALFDQRRAAHLAAACGPDNGWCDAADLDRTGLVDDVDAAFMAAAQGCRY